MSPQTPPGLLFEQPGPAGLSGQGPASTLPLLILAAVQTGLGVLSPDWSPWLRVFSPDRNPRLRALSLDRNPGLRVFSPDWDPGNLVVPFPL